MFFRKSYCSWFFILGPYDGVSWLSIPTENHAASLCRFMPQRSCIFAFFSVLLTRERATISGDLIVYSSNAGEWNPPVLSITGMFNSRSL